MKNGERVTVKCQFLEDLSLGSLVAPISKEEFVSRYWGREPFVIHRGKPDYYDGLFSLDDFDDAITRDPSYIKLANAEANKNVSYKNVVPGLEAALADLRDGGTLVLDQMHNKDPNLGLLCNILAPECSHRFQTNLYLTPPNGRGFTPHWDNHDVFILQVEGSKLWHVEKERRAVPKKAETMGDQGRELRGGTDTFKLNKGDLIYIPRGFVHAAECGPEFSLHITLGFSGFYNEDMLNSAVAAIAQQNEDLRGVLPFGFMHNSPKELAKYLKGMLNQMADDTFLNAFVEEYLDVCVKTFKLDISKQVSSFLRPTPVLITDVVGPRRGIVYRVHPGDDSVRINLGTRSISFLGIFKDALDFALSTPSFAVSDLPGELEDVERIVFIERLMQEGLIVRK